MAATNGRPRREIGATALFTRKKKGRDHQRSPTNVDDDGRARGVKVFLFILQVNIILGAPLITPSYIYWFILTNNMVSKLQV